MAAFDLHWVPETLYNIAITKLVSEYQKMRSEIKMLPNNVLMDVMYKLYHQGRLCELSSEISDLDTMSRLLDVYDKKDKLHHCFQVGSDHGRPISRLLAEGYSQLCQNTLNKSLHLRQKTIQLGLNLSLFLCDAGWYSSNEVLLKSCLSLCKTLPQDELATITCTAQCCTRLLSSQLMNCCYRDAEVTWLSVAGEGCSNLKTYPVFCQVALLTQASFCAFAQSDYNKALHYSCQAMALLPCDSLSPRDTVDIFRQCAKCFAVKRNFTLAEHLITFALQYAKREFGNHHQKYADVLMDFGYFLVNVDRVTQAVEAYQGALDVWINCFGGKNRHVAIAHEDLAYAKYVQEYSTGNFSEAREHAQTAIDILRVILPKDHLSIASSKRVKALILEEIAIDSNQKATEEQLLNDAHELHCSSLALVLNTFGEMNVQTAKHYGNLGRLYQSMHKYEEAEKMHLRAIEIKETILGPNDYEVALSVGHLASLYNYDMKKYEKAEPLYLRSIEIGRRLFGEAYSGLEYDYRGLIRLYHDTSQAQSALQYSDLLHRWAELRERAQRGRGSNLPSVASDVSTSIEIYRALQGT